jgi:hypothetical protein
MLIVHCLLNKSPVMNICNFAEEILLNKLKVDWLIMKFPAF